ncbi:cell surface protein [Mucilaginibacter dorajii]|uniref:Cell surface protein n=1 Tax=Mucilaginibacter dorajii TaxID=692994 RepID=A0ABP7PG95_9SPHI|nr:cell surface protein [Mucilaginibacter dorajii]MCS3735372.1 hypothetical protein [Mucilaginibacter dorajii]
MIETNLKRNLAIAFLLAMAALASCTKDKGAVVTPQTTVHPTTAASNAYVTTLFDFNPAPGQFINTTLADTAAAKATLKTDQGLVSLGAWGGYIVVGFDHTVMDVDGKKDFVVYGNAFALFAEPGVIWVMQDTNGNGKPDDTWYEIKGSAYYKEGYTRNYSVTYTRPACDTCSVPWKDNKGNTGVIQTNIYNVHPYFPLGIKGNTATYTGSLLPSSNINMDDPSYITSASFDYGYGDNTAGGDQIDIASAIDANGNAVSLKGIDFIKVQTGILANMGWLGEQSTEFTGAADISLLKP